MFGGCLDLAEPCPQRGAEEVRDAPRLDAASVGGKRRTGRRRRYLLFGRNRVSGRVKQPPRVRNEDVGVGEEGGSVELIIEGGFQGAGRGLPRPFPAPPVIIAPS